MPGPIALRHVADGWVVECRLCAYVSDLVTPDDVAEDLAYDHVVAAHPEVEEP